MKSTTTNHHFVRNMILALATGILGTNAALAQDSRESSTITIGIGNEPPYTELKPDGTLTGMGPDVDREALAEAGITDLSGVPMAYGAMIPAIAANRVQMLSSGSLVITPERCERVRFSEPVTCNTDAFLMREGEVELNSYAMAAEAKARLTVGAGTVQQTRAMEAGVPQNDLVIFPDGMSGVRMLQDGRVDALVLSDTAILDLMKRADDDTLQIVMPLTDAPISCGAAAFHEDDTELLDAYNAGLAKLKESGKLHEILLSYGLETNAELLSAAPTTAELCDQ